MTGAERLERNRPGCIRRVSDVMVSRFALIASEDPCAPVKVAQAHMSAIVFRAVK
jgi:hypothetical protein